MEIDSPPDFTPPKPRDRIIRRLVNIGVPEDFLDYPGIVTFAKNDGARIPELVSAILPTDGEVAEVIREARERNKKASVGPNMKGRFRESMLWLQWLMFESEPEKVLRKLSKIGQRGVCGAVWGNNDIAYRCRTCEHDPTCAICVPCFQNGNHKDHDYSIIYTGGGCCDCGDVTAWKREGFCSKHKGAEQIQPLPEKFANSAAPVLDALFICWENKLSSAETVGQENPRVSDHVAERRKVANELTFAVVEMVLEFCKNSESLLSFVSKRVISVVGLLDILVRAERFLSDVVVRKLHELLFKLLGEPIFKYEFAKVFLSYYPVFVNDATRECSDDTIKKYQLLSTFSVQIFTVPTLTPRLVKEMNLLEMLLGCLGDIFVSCAGEDGCLQVSKCANLYETTNRVIGDIRFVMSHVVVSKYATHDQRDISKTWMKLLTFVQGMNPQKRETGIHIREENEYMHFPLVLDHSIANIQPLLVDGAFSSAATEETADDFNIYKQDMSDGDSLRHAKVGRLSQESSVCGAMERSGSSAGTSKADHVISDAVCDALLPPPVKWLAHECLKVMEDWLGVDDNRSASLNDVLSPNTGRISGNNFLALKKTLSKIKKGKYIFSRFAGSSDVPVASIGIDESGDSENAKSMGKESKTMDSGERDKNSCRSVDFSASGMEGESAIELEGLRVLSLCYWPDIVYDVSLQDVSVHIPLHRLLSLILQNALRRCYGEKRLSAVSMDFFGHVLAGCHPYGFSSFVMEHPLRIRVFCAQVHAGMWRRNGDAALSSCEWYRAVRWSEQGLELDLFLLQCCAALAPADLYVNRIIERFGVTNYLSLNLERSSEYEPVLVLEMLTLIIQILQERRFCGLTTAESLKRELVHKLAIGDATHSQLVKSLPRDLSKFDQLQEILDTVATYSNPSGFNQGMYSLRWAYWKELDLYHPRWSSRDLQVAEERYLRFCSVSALTAQLPRWTKIYYPVEGIVGVATCKVVLQLIRTVLFYAVFTDKSTDSRAPYGVILTALHLLALALDICSQKRKSGDQSGHLGKSTPILDFAGEEIAEGLNYGAGKQSLLSLLVSLMGMHKKESMDNFLEAGNCNLSSLIESLLKKFAEIDSRCMIKLQHLAPEIVSHLSQSLPRSNTSESSSTSESERRKAKARERQAAILAKMKAEQFKFLSSISSTADDGRKSTPDVTNTDAEQNSEESVQDVCSLCHDPKSKTPVSYLILLQKSRLLSFVDRGPPSWDQDHWLGKENGNITSNHGGTNISSSGSGMISSSQLPQIAEDVVNQFAYNGLTEEVNAFLEFVKAHFPSVRNIEVPSTLSNGSKSTVSTLEMFEQDIYISICREMHKNMPCPDFMEEDDVYFADGGPKNSGNADSLLLGKYMAGLSRETRESPSASEVSGGDRMASESTLQLPVYDGFGPMDCDGIHLSSCGHAVHQGCLDRYISSLKERYNRRIIFEGGHIVDPDQGEFLCPVCRQLANSVLPALPWDFKRVYKQPTSPLDLTSREESNSLRLQHALSLLQSTGNVVGKDDVIKSFPTLRNERTSSNLEAVSRRMCKMYFQNKQDKFFGSARVDHSLIMWDTLKYSLMSMEISARSEKTSMTPIYDINALYKELKSSSGFVLSLLLKVIQSMRSKNFPHMLQRFRAIQLFSESICSGISIDHPGSTSGQGGNVLSILKHADMEVSYPDIQFWNRASDPILARDPFSSLMWILFCLPCQFISCKESLLSLVHIFYAVTVAQAVISYCGKHQSKVNELGLCDCLVTDISKLLGESGSAQEFFVSNYIDPSCDIKDMIRRLSFPYLRRCALLWKLLNSTVPPPFVDRDHVLDQSHDISDLMDSNDGAFSDLNEIHQVEKMFKIPPLDDVLKDEVLRSLVLKWLHHFFKEFEARRFQRVLHSTPAVPFKLMHLPYLYQDLLQRYIKQCCPDCKSVLDEPALCLLCGRLCSPSWKSCCRESGCQSHAMVCGAGTGVFLLIRRTTILLQRSARQSPWPSPYLDVYGEEDIEMNRGKPLYLNEERYAALTYMTFRFDKLAVAWI
ncbi:E3 ubiquitin-protein ligase PRT6-like [Melia azedarach]|uniref:E3 ubiquitin-protein ligase PRT6-like n=1 Tax=Melia azedarach TaxID=155640 RepID=A0ACC1X1X3_MELAZ|nr:E3 ubiquitin-protein ligase PRT6-like [Melia azedarach]